MNTRERRGEAARWDCGKIFSATSARAHMHFCHCLSIHISFSVISATSKMYLRHRRSRPDSGSHLANSHQCEQSASWNQIFIQELAKDRGEIPIMDRLIASLSTAWPRSRLFPILCDFQIFSGFTQKIRSVWMNNQVKHRSNRKGGGMCELLKKHPV